jgi:hypothetical protein
MRPRHAAYAAFLLVLLALGIVGASYAVGESTGTVVACATVTSPVHTVAVDGTDAKVIPGDVASNCVTSTYTVPTVISTVTVGGTTTTTPSTTTAPTTTTTPASGWGSGLAVIKYGGASFTGLPGLSSYQDYQADQTNWNQVASQPGRTLYYICGVNIPDASWSSSCGVPISVARANGWILKNSTGGEVKYNNCGETSYLADIGSTGYQQEFIKDVSAILAARPGVEGVMVDNVQGSRYDFCTRSVKYPDDGSYRAAMLSFVKAFGPALQAKGYYVSVNHFMNDANYSGPWGDGCSASQFMYWENQIASSIDGFCMVHWQPNWNNNARRKLGTTCNDFWDSWEKIVGNIEGQGKDFLPFSSSNDTDGSATYTRASFLLETNRPSSAFGWACLNNYSASCNPLTADGGVWAKNMGAPLGPKTVSNGVYTRRFTNGTVTVNPAAGTATSG